MGFRNALEDYKKLVDRNTDVCLNFSDVDFRYTELHNRVHTYIGGAISARSSYIK